MPNTGLMMRNVGRSRVSQTPLAAVDEFQPHLQNDYARRWVILPNWYRTVFVDLERVDVKDLK